MDKWIIANEKDDAIPEIGKIYEIRHSRKGTFIGKIVSVSGSFAKVEILNGEIKWASKENRIFNPNPEFVDIKDSLSYLTSYKSEKE